jgi:hypothetical protein
MRDKKHRWIKKYACGKNLPYQISISPASMSSYDRGQMCLFYIRLLKTKIETTEKVADQVYLDFDKKNRLVGVEII